MINVKDKLDSMCGHRANTNVYIQNEVSEIVLVRSRHALAIEISDELLIHAKSSFVWNEVWMKVAENIVDQISNPL